MLAVAAVLIVLATALGLVVQATVARARAQAVADLSAIAAARAVQRATYLGEPGPEPCTLAAEVAEHNGGRIVGCTEDAAAVVTVDAAVSTSVGTAHATARAGPRQ